MPSSLNDQGSKDRDPRGARTRTHELLTRYLGGDRAAEERLFSRFRASLLERARRHPRLRPIAREVTAEDAVQEVFQRALRSGLLRDFDDRGPGSLDALLSKVLDNTLVDLARRIATRKRGGGHARVTADPARDPRLEHLPSDDTTPTSAARKHELIELARSVLEPHELEVWTAIELHELDSAELGQRAGASASSIRGVLFRAKKKLLAALERRRGTSRS